MDDKVHDDVGKMGEDIRVEYTDVDGDVTRIHLPERLMILILVKRGYAVGQVIPVTVVTEAPKFEVAEDASVTINPECKFSTDGPTEEEEREFKLALSRIKDLQEHVRRKSKLQGMN